MPSDFARQMREILNAFCEVMDFTWTECAIALGVKEADLQDWINDRSFPNSRTFRSVHDLIYNWSPKNPEFTKVRELMATMLLQDLREITPLADQIEGFRRPGDCRTLNDYLVLPVLEGFLNVLECINREQMEIVLHGATSHVRRLRDDV